LVQADGRSYFYQFPLDEEAAAQFGLKVAAKRGKVVDLNFRVLPMGFSYAPGIAQHTSRTILENVSTQAAEYKAAWVDNFLLGTRSRRRAEELVAELKEVCGVVNLELKEDIMVSQEMRVLGTIVNARTKTIRPDPESTKKMTEAWEDWHKRRTPRAFFIFAGRALWIVFAVAREPLSKFEDVLRLMAELATWVGEAQEKWDAKYPGYEEAVGWSIQEAVKRAVWRPRVKRGERKVGWSDASTRGIGMICEAQKGDDGWWVAEALSTPIFLNELLAAATLLRHAEKEGVSMDIQVDNQAACAALVKGHSSSGAGNLILRKLAAGGMRRSHTVTWVPSAMQRADALSRGWWEAPAGTAGTGGKKLRWASKSTESGQVETEEKGGGAT
jgi:hypothetical protein